MSIQVRTRAATYSAHSIISACPGGLYAAYASWHGINMLSVVVTPVFLGVVLLARARKLYAATFLLALPLEFYGTGLGNWRWEPYVPGVGLSMANPPVCIGAIYCARDALAALTVTLIRLRRSSPPLAMAAGLGGRDNESDSVCLEGGVAGPARLCHH